MQLAVEEKVRVLTEARGLEWLVSRHPRSCIRQIRDGVAEG